MVFVSTLKINSHLIKHETEFLVGFETDGVSSANARDYINYHFLTLYILTVVAIL